MPIGSRGPSKLAARGYVSEMCHILTGELYKEHSRLGKGAYIFAVKDLAKFKNSRTFNIDLEGLQEALEQDRLVVYSFESDEKSEKSIVAKGFISSIEDGKIKIILDAKPKFEKEKKTEEDPGMKFEIRFDVAQFDKRARLLEQSVECLASAKLAPHIMNCLMNYYEERDNTKFIQTRVVDLACSPELSKKQKQAVEQSLMKKISLIEGLAGSGKTLVAANIAFSMGRIREKRIKVLLCSPFQATVNQLVKILSSEDGISVVQLTPDLISNRWDESYNRDFCLREWAQENVGDRWIRRLRKHSLEPTNCSPYMSGYRIKKAERARLEEADIVCCTLEQSLKDCLRDINFNTLIIDDAQYAKEYECLLAIRFKSIEQITMIGDMRRSDKLVSRSMRSGRIRSPGGRIKNRYNRRSSFIADSRIQRSLALANEVDQLDGVTSCADIGSLFERWLARGLPSAVLKFRYRSLDKLNVFLRQHFYPFDATVSRNFSTGQSPNERVAWPPKTPVMFDIHHGSFENTIQKLLADINKWDKAASVCLITNHEPDTRRYPQLRSIDIGCVSDFLGQQRDYVILMCKKTTESKAKRKYRVKNDFLSQDNALLIALTRARCNLFIITDLTETMLDDETGDISRPIGGGWKSLVRYFQEGNLVLQEYPAPS